VSRLQMTRTQKPSIEEKYRTYLASNGEPVDASSNPLNLFDATNVEDTAWFSLAQIYMAQRKKDFMTKQHDEEFNVKAEDLVDKIKGLFHEGNVRRVIIKNKDNKAIIEIPLTIGVVSAVMAPALAAVGAIAALITECTLTVQREL
jgi:hypothetical protein